MVKEYSCGAILFCYDENVRKYVLVQEASGSYGFPKGHKENDETDIETAKREIFEETGIVPEFIPNMKRTMRYKLMNDSEKEVTFFVAKYKDQEFNSTDKTILAIKKFDYKAAKSVLKFNELKNILTEVDYMLDIMGE